MTPDSLGKAPVASDSRSYIEGALPFLENSQASLNKRLASVAGLDEERGPIDFKFLLNGDMQVDAVPRESPRLEKRHESEFLGEKSVDSQGIEELASFQAVVDTLAGTKEPPASFDEGGVHWVNSQIKKSSELIDGQAWIVEFQRRFEEARAKPQNASIRELPLRNHVLKDMRYVSPPGRKVLLPTGQEVIFWFNIGAPGPPRTRLYVTEAYCPHQRACLLGAELMEIEDLATGCRPVTRCPRHNKRFDLGTGESAGNSEKLRHFPSRFEHGCWYVGVGPAEIGAEVASTTATEGEATGVTQPADSKGGGCCPEVIAAAVRPLEKSSAQTVVAQVEALVTTPQEPKIGAKGAPRPVRKKARTIAIE